MKTVISTEVTKVITAEDGKVLTNGGEFEQYPIELTTDINDNSWYEIDKSTLSYTELYELDLLRQEHNLIGGLINE